MSYEWEIIAKIREAQKNQLSDFSYVDHSGEEVEVHIEQKDPRIVDLFDWMS